MKKVFLTAMVLVLLVCTMMNLAATTPAKDTLYIGDTEVIFEEGSSFTAEQKQRIAEFLVNGTVEESTVQPKGFMCNVFGHKTSTSMVESIDHCVSATSPRCRYNRWEVTTCSRCDYTTKTLVFSEMIVCCP